MEDYLHSRKPTVIRENFQDDMLSRYLERQGPIVLEEISDVTSDVKESFSEDVIIPPLNTDIRFSKHLPLHIPTHDEAEAYSHSHPHAIIKESFSDARHLIIPPLNTDIRFSKELPLIDPIKYGDYQPHDHDHPSERHPHELHTHEHTHENFSWAVPTVHDSPLDLIKKSLIHKVSTQHACGSCWDI